MCKVKVLVEGYVKVFSDTEWKAHGTTSLIESNGKKILVDPGADKDALLDAMKSEGLEVGDIDAIFLTHYHMDHLLNIRLFPDTIVYDGDTIYGPDKEQMYDDGMIPGTSVKIIETPGHAAEHASPVVQTDDGIVVIAEDVFWWEDGEQKSDTIEELMNLEDPYMKDAEALQESRKKVLEIADWIIPGHGKMFRNPAKI